MSLREFNIYTGHGGESAMQLVDSDELSTSALLSNVDRYSNLTIGVSLVNSAGLESDIERTLFIGSKHPANINISSSCALCLLTTHMSCSIILQLSDCCRFTWVVPEKGPLNGCVCVATKICITLFPTWLITNMGTSSCGI